MEAETYVNEITALVNEKLGKTQINFLIRWRIDCKKAIQIRAIIIFANRKIQWFYYPAILRQVSTRSAID